MASKFRRGPNVIPRKLGKNMCHSNETAGREWVQIVCYGCSYQRERLASSSAAVHAVIKNLVSQIMVAKSRNITSPHRGIYSHSKRIRYTHVRQQEIIPDIVVHMNLELSFVIRHLSQNLIPPTRREPWTNNRLLSPGSLGWPMNISPSH